MRVGLDVNSLMQERLTGVGVYAFQLIQALMQHTDLELLGLYKPKNKKNKEVLAERLALPARVLWPLPVQWQEDMDLYHGLDCKLPRFGKVPQVVTLHDLLEHKPGLMDEQLIHRYTKIVERTLLPESTDAIIVVTEAIKRQLLALYPHLSAKVHVVYHGVDHIPTHTEALRPHSRPYLLHVGSLDWRKNLLGVVQTFEMLARDYPDLDLVVLGNKGYRGEEILEGMQRSPFASRIIHKPNVGYDGLLAHYQYAEALVFLSLYEGFGFPALEAMRMGCPVVTSNQEALSEIVGSAAVKVNPEDYEAAAKGIERILTDSAFRQRLVEVASQHVHHFTWAKAASETIAVYRQVLA